MEILERRSNEVMETEKPYREDTSTNCMYLEFYHNKMGFVFSLSTKVLIEIPTYPFIGPIGYIIIKTQNNLNSPEVVISQRFYKIVNQNNCGYTA